jgi:hypothetical protein
MRHKIIVTDKWRVLSGRTLILKGYRLEADRATRQAEIKRHEKCRTSSPLVVVPSERQ